MATRTTTTIWNNASDANFRAWGSWFSGCFSAFGWTLVYQAFATGTNWTDVTAPAAVNTARVTEVWAMADAAQATAPCYVKIEYGAFTAATTPGIRFSVGTGHAGSGALSGVLYDTGTTYNGGSVSNANSMTHYSSGDTGRIWIAMSVHGTSWANTNDMVISVERRRDATGAVQTTGFLITRKGGSTLSSIATLAASAHPNTLSSWNFPICDNTAAGINFDSKVGIFPLLYAMGPSEMGLHIVAASNTSYTAGSQFSCTVLGSARNYLMTQSTGMTGLQGGTLISPAYLYE
jgi:hypothetical protein